MREILNNIIYMARRFKLASLLNIVGLIVAFASFYLLIPQIVYQLTYNHGVEDYKRIYRLESNYDCNGYDYSDNVCRPFAEALRHLPNVESFSLIRDIYSGASTGLPFKKGEKTLYFPFSSANSTALSTLKPQVIDGTIAWPDSLIDSLRRGLPDSLLISLQKSLPYSFLKSLIDSLPDSIQKSLQKNLIKSLPDSLQKSIQENLQENLLKSVIIPARIAQEYFGTIQAVGKKMFYFYKDSLGNDKTKPYEVIGVYKDFPKNCELPNCIFQYIDSTHYYDFYSLYKCYVKFTKAPENLESLGDSLRQAILTDLDKNAVEYIKLYGDIALKDNKDIIKKTKFKFTSLSGSYFELNTFTAGDHGFKSMAIILALSCLLIIIIATINFLNFTLAESPMRMRSLNTRLVLGANRRSMRMKLVIECIIVAVATCLAGLAICDMLQLLPIDSLPLTGNLSVKGHWPTALLTLVLAVLVGAVAGIYPAVFATSYPPAIVLKGTFGLTPQGRQLRTILVCLQLFISMLMVIYIGILFLQSQHIINSSYGFNKDQLLYSGLPDNLEPSKIAELKNDLMQLPDVENVSFSENLLGTTDGHYNIKKADQYGNDMEYNYMHTDQDFMRTMDITIVEGRDFNKSDSAAVIINESNSSHWKRLHVGDFIPTSADDNSNDSAIIVGICKDIRYGTMHVNNNQPFGFILDRDYPYILDKLFIRVAEGSDMESARQQIDSLVQHYSDNRASEVVPYNNSLIKTYHNELQYSNHFYMISLFCLIITLIGLFCMTMFETEYRRKEIGIRKVAGATTGEIVWMLCSRYGGFILICFAVAAPIAKYFGEKTLNDYYNFAERASISWWIFPMSLLVVGGIMLGTVVLQGWLAARKNPASTIKTE